MNIDGSLKQKIDSLSEGELKIALEAYRNLCRIFDHSGYENYYNYVKDKLRDRLVREI